MGAILCEHCTAVCCSYIALPIDKPDKKAEYEDLRWFLIHERVSVFIEEGDWYIAFQTPCRHLQPDHRCGIYETRPRICRKYSTENCDYHSGDYGWDHHFTCAEHLDAYMREHTEFGGCPTASDAEAGRRRPVLRAAPSRRRSAARARHREEVNAESAAPRLDRRGLPLPVLPISR
jgi:Fe-S-cluster containining protein